MRTVIAWRRSRRHTHASPPTSSGSCAPTVSRANSFADRRWKRCLQDSNTGRIAQWVATQLTLYQQQIRQYLGEVVIETGFVIRYPDSESVRAPDVAFIRKERVPDPRPHTFAEFAPDLVVEVVSPE
jgi:hypothetical protein